MKRLSHRIGVWASFAILMAGLLAALIMCANVRVERIASGSMTGTIPQGALVFTYRTPGMQLHRRDIIAFKNPEDKAGVTTHTFLGTREDSTLITHGDANPSLDNFDHPPYPADVIGKVGVHIDLFTTVFWRSNRGMVLGLALVLAGIAGLMLSGKEVEKKDAHPAT